MLSHGELRSTYRIPRYSRLPSLTSSISAVVGSSGGFPLVTRPPASCRIQIPAATSLREHFSTSEENDIAREKGKQGHTYHSQHPPSHQISKDPIAVYARSIVALQRIKSATSSLNQTKKDILTFLASSLHAPFLPSLLFHQFPPPYSGSSPAFYTYSHPPYPSCPYPIHTIECSP
jgi:hypothetical protein